MRLTRLRPGAVASGLSSQNRRHRSPLRNTSSSRAVTAKTSDYFANATDDGVLQLPLKQQLDEDQLTHVFGYDRDLQGKCVHAAFADLYGQVVRLLKCITPLRAARPVLDQ